MKFIPFYKYLFIDTISIEINIQWNIYIKINFITKEVYSNKYKKERKCNRVIVIYIIIK